MIIARRTKYINSYLFLFFLAILFCSSVHSDESTNRYVLENGVTVIIKELHSLPLVALRLGIKAGSATEGSYAGSGISHFVEHMLFKGTPRRPPGAVEKEIKSLGGYINGSTGLDVTSFHCVLPSEHYVKGLDVLSDLVQNANFDPEEFEKERAVILKEINMNIDKPARYINRLLWSNVFKWHPYKYPVIGLKELFEGLKREDLIQYYRQRYTPENMVLAIVGDVNTDEVLRQVKLYFGNIKRHPVEPVVMADEPPQISQIVYQEQKDELGNCYVSLGFRTVAIRDPDIFALDTLSMILGQGRDSRLFKRLYVKDRLVYSISSVNYTPFYPGIFLVNFIADRANVDKTIGVIFKEIESLKHKPPSAEELRRAKNNVLSGYLFSRQTVEGQAQDLVYSEILTGDYEFSKKYVEGINAVKPKDVLQVAQRYLKRTNLTIVKLFPSPKQKGLEKGLRKSRREKIHIEKIRLKNGIRLLIYEGHKHPLVSIRAVFQGGLRAEDFWSNGLSNLVADLLVVGTEKRTEQQLFYEIESIGATLNSFSGKNSFGISIDAMSKDLKKVIEILADCILHPTFPLDKIQREKSALLASYRAQKEDIYHLGMKTLKYNLYKKHPYRYDILGRPKTIKRFTKADILRFYKRYCTPRNLVLAIFGDVDKEVVESLVKKAFINFKGEYIVPSPPKVVKRPKKRLLIRKVSKQQSLLLLGYLGATLAEKDRYALEVLSSVLSGISGRMSFELREKLGLAYTLNSVSFAGVEPGMFLFYVGTVKDKLGETKDALFSLISSIRENGVKADEVADAKSELIGLRKIALQSYGSLAMEAAINEVLGLGYDDFLRYEENIKDVTKDDVQRVVHRYLEPDSYIMVLVEGK